MLENARSEAQGAERIMEKEVEKEFDKEFRSPVLEDASLNEASLNEASLRAFNARVHTSSEYDLRFGLCKLLGNEGYESSSVL